MRLTFFARYVRRQSSESGRIGMTSSGYEFLTLKYCSATCAARYSSWGHCLIQLRGSRQIDAKEFKNSSVGKLT